MRPPFALELEGHGLRGGGIESEGFVVKPGPVLWWRSLIAAATAAYAPFGLLALFMLAFERQWGNTVTAIRIAPFGPGLLATIALGGLFDGPAGIEVPRPVAWLVPFTASATFIAAVALLGRLGRDWLVGGAVAAFFVNAITAYWLVGAIRM